MTRSAGMTGGSTPDRSRLAYRQRKPLELRGQTSSGMITNAINALATAFVLALSLILGLKVVWNLGLPYAMLRHPERKGWSIFPLIEFAFLLAAVMIAWAGGLTGALSPGRIGLVGGIAIVASYVHLIIIPPIYGIIVYGILGKKDD